MMNFTSNETCPDGIWWIEHILGQCVTNSGQLAGVVIALLSLICFIIASLPQIIENWRKGKADEALSIGLILFWLAGDTTNLVACHLVNQLPIQIYTAYYYVAMDILILTQFAYYSWKNRKFKFSIRQKKSNEPNRKELCAIFLLVTFSFSSMEFAIYPASVHDNKILHSRFPAGRTLLHQIHPVFKGWETIVGYTLGCISTSMYMGSRFPQLIKNLRRKSVEGVSVYTFMLIVVGNSLYGTSVVLGEHGDPYQYYVRAIPWLVGSFVMVLMDFMMFAQFWKYKYRKRQVISLEVDGRPLLEEPEIN